jgi:hypothetical protein
MFSLWSKFVGTYSSSKRSEPVPDPAPIYIDMRNRVITLDPKDVGIVPTKETPNVWGTLMEMGYPTAVVTLLSLADGTTSLYFGNGGGILGGGGHENVSNRSKAFIAMAEKFFRQMKTTEMFPLPLVGTVKFYIFTFSGVYTADVDEFDLGERKHAFSPLYDLGQDVITQLRLISEQKN